MGELVDLGVRMFTDDGTGVQDDQLMRRALEYAASLDPGDGTNLVLSQHCEDNALSQGGVMHEGEYSKKFGLPGIPTMAEEKIIRRDIALAEKTGCRLHIQHVTSRAGVDLIRAARTDENEAATPAVADGHRAIFRQRERTANDRGKPLGAGGNEGADDDTGALRLKDDLVAAKGEAGHVRAGRGCCAKVISARARWKARVDSAP